MADALKKFIGIRKIPYTGWKDFVTKRMDYDEENVVWRGQASDHDNLLPSIYRQHNPQFGVNELKTLRMFYEQCQGLVSDSINLPPIDFKRPANFDQHDFFTSPECLKWWSLAQHFGLPTPFLDWSYYPLVSLFFAMTDFSQIKRPKVRTVDVWELSQATGIDELGESVLQRIFKLDNRVIADGEIYFFRVHGFHNRRVVAQAGVFTYVKPPKSQALVTSSDYDIKYLFESLPVGILATPDFSLNRHVITVSSKKDVEECRRVLAKAGITQRTLFPDIPGVIEDCRYRISMDDYTCCQVPPTQRDMDERYQAYLDYEANLARDDYDREPGEA